MGIFAIFLVSVALSMDAFAVAICKGLAMKKLNFEHALIIALYLGIAHVVMPIIGYLAGLGFESIISNLDHWLACILLGFIGLKMLFGSAKKPKHGVDDAVDFKTMSMLALATSVDTLVVGITFSFLDVDLLTAVSILGLVTFVLVILGVRLGTLAGKKYHRYAEMFGGIILIAIGIKILLSHLW